MINWMDPYLSITQVEGEIHIEGIGQVRPLSPAEWLKIHSRVLNALLTGSLWSDLWRVYGMMWEHWHKTVGMFNVPAVSVLWNEEEQVPVFSWGTWPTVPAPVFLALLLVWLTLVGMDDGYALSVEDAYKVARRSEAIAIQRKK